MKKNYKKIITLSVLTLFLMTFAITMVMAADANTNAFNLQQAEESIFTDNPIAKWFGQWEEGKQFSANIAKYLFWALISIVIYSIAGQIPGIISDKEGIKWTFSIIVGFLTMAYVTPAEVYSLMTSYTALGIVLGGAIPFVILLYFTITIAGSTYKKNAAGILSTRILAYGLWIAFTGFLFIKAVNAPGDVNAPMQWGMMILSLAVTIGMSWIFKNVSKEMRRASQEKFTTNAEKRKALARQEIEQFEAQT